MARTIYRQTATQWGVVAGLLMFSFVTLSGIAFHLEPFVISQRALTAAVLIGTVTQLTVRVLAFTMHDKRRGSRR